MKPAKIKALRAGVPFSDRLKAAREKAGLSQSQAARAISPLLSVRTLQKWEIQEMQPPLWAQALVLLELDRATQP